MLQSARAPRLCVSAKGHNVHRLRSRAQGPISRQKLAVRASANPQSTATKEGKSTPYLKCDNPFTDDWVFIKGEEELALSFRDINQYLIDEGAGPADAVRPRQAQSFIRTEGYTLVDLRIQWSYDEWHLEGAHHVPMLRVIEGNGAAKIWRKFGHALFVEFPPVEHNYPNWLEAMMERFDKDDKILLACDFGGLLDSNLVKAVSSNTFEAMFMLKQAGFTNVKYLQGGFCSWRSQPGLLENTSGIVDNVPWFKKMRGVSGFFPAPCNWTHVRRCACPDDEDTGASDPCGGECLDGQQR